MSNKDLIIWVSVLSTVLIFGFYIIPSFGDRGEIDSVQKQIDDLEREIPDFDISLEEHKIKMVNNEKTLKEAKLEYKKLKNLENKSWDGIENARKGLESVQKAEEQIEKDKIRYLEILTEKSDAIKKKKELELKLVELQKGLKFHQPNLIKLIGVDISDSCMVQHKNNFTTLCPDYKDLWNLDSSNKDVSGHFVIKDGIYQREKSGFKESWRWYDHDKEIRIIVDPPQGMAERIRTITIQDNFDTYLLPESKNMKQNLVFVNVTSKPDAWGRNQTYITTNKTISVQDTKFERIVYHDRYVDDNCKHAVINAKKWLMLLPDTIDYMRNNCDSNHTSFNHKEIIIQNMTEHDITTSQKYKDEQRLKYIKEFCIFKFKSCVD